jgi:hypothetical protein
MSGTTQDQAGISTAKRSMHCQVLLLATAQALFQTASVMVMTIGGLAGAAVAGDPKLATLPIAAMFLGTAISSVPAATWMVRVGRRMGFLLPHAVAIDTESNVHVADYGNNNLTRLISSGGVDAL